MDRREPFSVLRALAPYLALWLLCGAVIGGAAIYGAVTDRERDRSGAEKDATNLARLMQTNAMRTVESIDRTLSLARAVQEHRLSESSLRTLFETLRLADDVRRRVSVFDRDGRFVTSTDSEGMLAEVSIANRDYFRIAREGTGDGLIVAPPLAGQLTSRMVVPVLKRVTSPAGEFEGVVLAGLDPTRLIDVYRGIDLGEDGFVGVTQRDGRIVARSGAPAPNPAAGAQLPVSLLVAQQPPHPTLGWATFAGAAYLVAAQPIPRTELFVFVAQPERDILAGNRRVWYSVTGLAALALAALAVPIGFAARRSLRVLREREALEARARIDPLTQTNNRAALEDRLRPCIEALARAGEPFTLAFIDTDNFKVLNDTRGHAEGDRALARIAGILQASVRKNDLVARMGGDEFAVLLPTGAAAATRRVFDQVLEMLRVLARREGWPISFSIGVVTFSASPESPASAIAVADRVMYTVKQTTKDGLAFAVLDSRGLQIESAGPEGPPGAASSSRGA